MDLAAAGRMCLRRAIKANRWSRVGRVNKFQFRSLVLRGSARPMTTTPDDFSIFFIFLPIPKNRGEKQTKSKNRILTMALCKTLFSNSLEKEKRYNIFPFLFPEIRYSDHSYSTILFWTQLDGNRIKNLDVPCICRYTIYQKKLRDIRSHRRFKTISFGGRTNQWLVNFRGE